MIETIRATRKDVTYMETDMPEVDLTDKEKKAWQELSYMVKFSIVFENYANADARLRVKILSFLIHWIAVPSFALFDMGNYIHRLEKALRKPGKVWYGLP